MQVSGTYVASGGEKYITIGNFNNDANTDTVKTDTSLSSGNICYYYIDDVTVAECVDLEPGSELFIPTAFSPNSDGNNDVLHVRGPIKEMNFYIYDRWGELVYHGTDPMQGWDGKFGGELLNSAVFTYYFRGKLTNGEEVTQKGNITLLR